MTNQVFFYIGPKDDGLMYSVDEDMAEALAVDLKDAAFAGANSRTVIGAKTLSGETVTVFIPAGAVVTVAYPKHVLFR